MFTEHFLRTNIAAQESEVSEVERIIVTAERRAMTENKMALPIMAFFGEKLENENITELDRLQYSVPNLVFTDNCNTKYLNIRGVGISESAPNQTTGVTVHLDGAQDFCM